MGYDWHNQPPGDAMDLSGARRVARHPSEYEVPEWERAFRILYRWAEEPCRKREYRRRLDLCRRVFVAINKARERAERKAARQMALAWKPKVEKVKNGKGREATRNRRR